MRDLYEILGVDRSCNPGDLKKAYRTLAMQHHPDRNPGNKEAEEAFKEASQAYEILSDGEQRARYDRFGMDGIRGASGGGGYSNVDDILSHMGDILGDFFGGRTTGRGRQPRGADLRVDLDLTFPEAVWGVTKEVKVTRDIACETCHGNGAAPGTKVETCATCKGKGQVVHAQGFFMVQTVCPTCRGAGKQIKEPCTDCRGKGKKPETTTETINVPAGVDEGQTLRLAGKGEAAQGGTTGHLYAVLHVQGDERFKRDEYDVYSEVPVSFVKAALGGEHEIYTLDEKVTATDVIALKAGTQPGDRIVRRNQGVPHVDGHGRGDHVVIWKVEIPKKLSAKQEELMRALATELGETVKAEKKGFFSKKK
ncbi:MAG TPA: molecular chaperone DnaJ [Kofleriaceae bacterium]|jgi:molecular chaperone DnaJ